MVSGGWIRDKTSRKRDSESSEGFCVAAKFCMCRFGFGGREFSTPAYLFGQPEGDLGQFEVYSQHERLAAMSSSKDYILFNGEDEGADNGSMDRCCKGCHGHLPIGGQQAQGCR